MPAWRAGHSKFQRKPWGYRKCADVTWPISTELDLGLNSTLPGYRELSPAAITSIGLPSQAGAT